MSDARHSSVPAIREQLPSRTMSDDIIKRMADDIGKDTCTYIEVMYPEAVKAASSTFLISVRGHIYNEIMGAIKHHDQGEIENWLEGRKVFRRKWKAQYKKIREPK